MMLTASLFMAACFVAYANGANDNFKGVASLFGSGICGYRAAIGWATITTFAGSISAVFLTQTLLQRFSGKGLVPDALIASPGFILAVAFGAGATVLLAALLGFPISTTHGLVGALVGAGFAAAGNGVNFAALGKTFVVPLLFSPLVAMAVGGLFNAKKVAETMSHKITGMNPGQSFAANLSTALLVTTESFNGLPVSTTHVSVGSLLGMGIVTGQAKWKPLRGVLASWFITLPCAALLAAMGVQIIQLF
jgi:phosphate/sulfate permease